MNFRIKRNINLNIFIAGNFTEKFFYILINSLFILLLLLFIKHSFSYAAEDSNVLIYSDLNYCNYNGNDGPDMADCFSERKSHLLDIYQPKDCHSCPVVVYVHGGTWTLGDKGKWGNRAKAFTSHNIVYVSINYRLAPDYQFPANAQDVARAFSWVKNNIADYGGDPEQIYLLGHSAGGHLSAVIALENSFLTEFGLTPSDISGIIGLDSAAYYLPSLFIAEPENQFMLSWAFGEDLEDLEKASPINYIKREEPIPPFLLLVAGGREVSVAVNNSFYKKLKENGCNVTLIQFEDKDHVTIDNELGEENDPVFPLILNWLKEN